MSSVWVLKKSAFAWLSADLFACPLVFTCVIVYFRVKSGNICKRWGVIIIWRILNEKNDSCLCRIWFKQIRILLWWIRRRRIVFAYSLCGCVCVHVCVLCIKQSHTLHSLVHIHLHALHCEERREETMEKERNAECVIWEKMKKETKRISCFDEYKEY